MSNYRLSQFSLAFCFVIHIVGIVNSYEFGINVVGGAPATVDQFPYQCSLREKSSHVCGCAIISNKYVVSAAHCVNTALKPSDYSIRAGSIFRTSGGTVVPIAVVRIHPEYNFPNNDVIVAGLANNLKYSSSIQPVTLANDNLISGAELQASGWGFTSTNGHMPNHLQWIDMKAITNEECSRSLSGIPESIQCLVSPVNQGICQGDSGGPAVRYGKLYGLVSFTPGSCGSGYPDGFVKISMVRSWIISQINL